jgi:hypothetical protein
MLQLAHIKRILPITNIFRWFGQMIGLPADFLPFTENGTGGGVIQVKRT